MPEMWPLVGDASGQEGNARQTVSDDQVAAVSALHVPSHGYCVVCDKDRDVEVLGNAFPCDHYTSFCRECDRKWPCRTYSAMTQPTPHVCQMCDRPLEGHPVECAPADDWLTPGLRPDLGGRPVTLRRDTSQPLIACAETRALAQEIGRLVRRGEIDAAADLLEAELDETYTAGHVDGYIEAQDD